MRTLTPAYGADYKTIKEVTEAYDSGKDFVFNLPVWGARYCSCRDFPNESVLLRFDRKSSSVVHMKS